MPYLKKRAKEFKFNQLSVHIDNKGIDDFNRRKQDIYINTKNTNYVINNLKQNKTTDNYNIIIN